MLPELTHHSSDFPIVPLLGFGFSADLTYIRLSMWRVLSNTGSRTQDSTEINIGHNLPTRITVPTIVVVNGLGTPLKIMYKDT
ncbi:hypothetical protein TNCV_3749371 [Trichonephila clavipes]|nr:hypothetical protein TNCV_3749371 [Trichonephila clavipes]